MSLKRLPFFLLLLIFTLSGNLTLRAETQYGDLAYKVVQMLEEEHFLQEPFNDKMSARVLEGYLEMLDFSRIYFTKEDVDGFRARHEKTIDDQVRNESIPAAFEIYKVYQERIASRVTMAQDLAKPENFTYDSDRTVQISRKDLDWAAAGEAHDQLWSNLIEGDLIREKLIADALAREEAEERAEKLEKGEPVEEKSSEAQEEDSKSIYEKVSDRYDRIQKRVDENQTEDVATLFIKSIARAYDPHSEYFSQQQYDNFQIGMNKSLTGIGAMLQKDEDQGGATIEGLVVGGPAFKGGSLEVKDRVIGVAQGEGEFVDVVEMKLSDIVDLIRGEVGSKVRLKVVPSGKTSEIKLVDIKRDKIDLKDSLATADLIETQDPTGKQQKLGWITLPSFYADMAGGSTSTTTDVMNLLTRLTIEGIDGLVVDLRDNGGGSLEEAINMTGLFIRRGPVVQAVDSRSRVGQKASNNIEAVYGGPLIVLVNHASASASEIFAAALQDYGRAVIVGDGSTFGKGTVQQLRPVLSNRLVLPFNRETNQQGALKLTIQTFYRINGYSTQRDGVVPDVQLPSILDIAEIGEATLPFALEVEPIPPAGYKPFFEGALPLDLLSQASAGRVSTGQAFEYILKDIEEEKKRIEENKISLNLEERKREVEADKKEAEDRKEERIERFAKIREEEKDVFTIYKLTQDNFRDEDLTLRDDLSAEDLSGMSRGKKNEEDEINKALEYPHKFDPYERETVQIMQDLIAISKTGQPVNISEATPMQRDKTVPIPARNQESPQAN
ncbi:MAG: carboxy terminal-processing peptidase [Verrucomicrobiales bacterium]|nr:carboxy terminal-processing peptidase [Verrucomicrobiales bacterium]